MKKYSKVIIDNLIKPIHLDNILSDDFSEDISVKCGKQTMELMLGFSKYVAGLKKVREKYAHKQSKDPKETFTLEEMLIGYLAITAMHSTKPKSIK